jgi:magnesium transporter
MKKKSDNANKAARSPDQKNDKEQHVTSEIEVLVYDDKISKTEHYKDFKKLKESIDRSKVNLVTISDLTDINLIEDLGKLFGIHPVVLEDALTESEIPKIQESGDQLLLTLKLMNFKTSGELTKKHIGLLLGDYFVIIFKDGNNKIFEDIKLRIGNGNSKARQKKADYLFYLLIDTVIDTYYDVVNELDNNIDKLEIVLLEHPETNYISNLYRIKQPMSEMRGVMFPIRESLLNMLQGDYPLIEDETVPFLHDVKDHVNNIVHMFESSRDTLSDLLEINNSNINNRLNATMKILTVITTLFIPLTLIAGIYGMNFKFFPELSWKFGYPMALGLMLTTAIIMYFIMKRKKIL